MDGIDGIWKRVEKWVVSLTNDLREVADAFCPILLFPWFCSFWLCSDMFSAFTAGSVLAIRRATLL